jgi:hypothetical protein
MIPIHVALFAYEYEEKDYVDTPTILRVAAALQMQLTRDFTPVWGIPAVVSGFASVQEVPPGCIPLVIVKPGSLQPRDHAFHITDTGAPIGLIEGGPGWSLPASHELLEIVCDPQGKTKVMAESIADHVDLNDFAPGAEVYQRPQGQVQYLLEICDPCQTDHYTVNGFQVSDFITPGYYAPGATAEGRYSFTGKVTKPRQVRPGGYVTWYTSIAEAPIWQAIRDTNDNLSVGPLPAAPVDAYSRDDLDYYNDYLSGLGPSGPSVPASRAEQLAKAAAARYGADLREELDHILGGYKAEREPPTVPLAAFVKIVKKLAEDEDDYWSRANRDPTSLASEPDVQALLPDGVSYPPGRFPTQSQFQAVYAPLKRLSDREAGLTVSPEAAITAMYGTTIWNPPPPPTK